MGWYIYFIISLLLFVRFGFDVFSQSAGFIFLVGFLLNIFVVLGHFSFVFNYKILSPIIWKFVFWAMILIIPLVFILSGSGMDAIVTYIGNIAMNSAAFQLRLVIGLLFVFPSYFAIYQLGRGNTRKDIPISQILRLQKVKK